MQSNLLFCPEKPGFPGSGFQNDPLSMLQQRLQARLASGTGQGSGTSVAGTRDLGVLRMRANLPDTTPEMAALESDLQVDVLLDNMAGGDRIVREVCRLLLTQALRSWSAIRYRQDTVRDALANRSETGSLYQLVNGTVADVAWYRRTHEPGYAETVPFSVKLHKAVGLLSLLLERCTRLKSQVLGSRGTYCSAGFLDFRAQVTQFLSTDNLENINRHVAMLASLSEGACLVVGAGLGPGCKGTEYVLRQIEPAHACVNGIRKKTMDRDATPSGPKPRNGKETIRIPLDNLSLSTCAAHMEDAVLTEPLRLANRLSEALQRFFNRLRFELAFLDGACRLADAVRAAGLPFCFPEPATGQNHARDELQLSSSVPGALAHEPSERPWKRVRAGGLFAADLVDASLGLREGVCPVPNGMEALSASLILITGANQGGKSTFLRSVGLAQLMAQCGLFTTARVYRTTAFDGIFTHFAREEDSTLKQGRLEEELERMDRLVQRLSPRSLLLMNESFATTTEREGARIAQGLILALAESGVTLLYVTHLLECASALYGRKPPDTLFFRAERSGDGTRPFRLVSGEPLATSYALDLYEEVMNNGNPVSNRGSGRDVRQLHPDPAAV
jgi:hypothetical protein